MNSVFKKIVIFILKIVHSKKNIAVIFHNDEDRKVFIDNKIIDENRAWKTSGSGVDLSVYQYIPEPDSDIVRILFTARMLRDKGVLELVDAAKILRENYYEKAQFLFCGDIDDNPRSFTKAELKNINDGQYVRWLGHRNDIRELLAHSHIFAFPSYYREGLPKSIIEACAIGRPIVTTNSPGCRDCVVDNYNGYLIPIKDSKLLASKLAILIDNKISRISMGKNSRILAEKYFSITDVVDKHMEIYNAFIRQEKATSSNIFYSDCFEDKNGFCN